MRSKSLVPGLLVALATLVGHVAPAAAQSTNRKMLVLIDASGSMTQLRSSDNKMRFEAAKERAFANLQNEAMMGLSGVAIYTFQDAGLTNRTGTAANPFVDINTANNALMSLDPNTVPAGVTPLAGSMCDAIDILAGTTASQRILSVSSDGEENATPSIHACFGPFSAINVPPFEADSWQNKVYVKATNPPGGVPMIVQVDLFNYPPITSLVRNLAAAVQETGTTTAIAAKASRLAAAAAEPLTLEQFFTYLAHDTGGSISVISDDVALPVYADFNGDGCVDFSDALQVAFRFGEVTPVVDGKFDLDHDGIVTFLDFVQVIANVTAECVADSYAVAEPITCSGSQKVVIDGKIIDDQATTITAYGSCKLTIKNSIIVAGGTAVNIYGAARVQIENSSVIGDSAMVDLTGAAVISAKNSNLKGRIKTTGAIKFHDLGGNTWY